MYTSVRLQILDIKLLYKCPFDLDSAPDGPLIPTECLAKSTRDRTQLGVDLVNVFFVSVDNSGAGDRQAFQALAMTSCRKYAHFAGTLCRKHQFRHQIVSRF